MAGYSYFIIKSFAAFVTFQKQEWNYGDSCLAKINTVKVYDFGGTYLCKLLIMA